MGLYFVFMECLLEGGKMVFLLGLVILFKRLGILCFNESLCWMLSRLMLIKKLFFNLCLLESFRSFVGKFLKFLIKVIGLLINVYESFRCFSMWSLVFDGNVFLVVGDRESLRKIFNFFLKIFLDVRESLWKKFLMFLKKKIIDFEG